MSNKRQTPIEIGNEEFKKIGHQLVDTIADFINTMQTRPVTTGESPAALQNILGHASLPEEATAPGKLITRAADLLLQHSLLNGHPKFQGYITSSAAPIGVFADMLADAVNPNVGAQILSPMATEIEKQTVRWLAEFIGVSPEYGGILVSGGNMANFTAFLTARTIKAPKEMKEEGLAGAGIKMVFYCSKATHTWVEKTAVLFGLGSRAIRWVPVDERNRMHIEALDQMIKEDLMNGLAPFLVIGNAGDVSTGAVDDFKGISDTCKRYNLWFHIDGAYGMPAAVVPELHSMFEGVKEADSIAIDPHKWLYSPLEAGCTLVKNPVHLTETYSAHPVYYNFTSNDEVKTHNFYEYGLQNSRGFRALKVWLSLQQAGKNGYVEMIREDMRLSKLFFDLARNHPDLEAISQNLSITTLRFAPAGYRDGGQDSESYLNTLNETLLNTLQSGGEVFLSNAVINNKYCLRGCIVNFRTSEDDIRETIDIIAREGKEAHRKLQEESGILYSVS